MAVLGRGITGLPLTSDSLIIGVSGLVDELPVGTLNQILTVTGGGVDWADATAAAVISVNGASGVVVLDLDDIDDVAVAAPSNDEVLTFQGGVWIAQVAPGAGGGEINTASNVGGGIEVFKQKTSFDLEFRTLIAGSPNITIVQNASDITFDVVGAAATEERFRLNYATNGNLSSVDNLTSGISSVNILSPTGGDCEINFTSHSYPPSSIIVYGYAYTVNEYNIKVIDANFSSRTVDGGGTSGSATAFGALATPMTLNLSEATTGSSRGFGTVTEAWVMFMFGD